MHLFRGCFGLPAFRPAAGPGAGFGGRSWLGGASRFFAHARGGFAIVEVPSPEVSSGRGRDRRGGGADGRGVRPRQVVPSASSLAPSPARALWGLAAALLLAVAGLVLPAHQARGQTSTEVPADWSLIPSDLGAGDSFRLIFASSTRRSGSATDIATYNTFVQELAAAGHSDIQAYKDGFRVVGCTGSTDARDNTSTTYTSADKGVAIYWLGGSIVANDHEDFYDGSWSNEGAARDESGSSRSLSTNTTFPITGCDDDGTESFVSGTSYALGMSTVQQGRPDSSGSGHGPLSSSANFTSSGNSRPMYGLSGVFTVASAEAEETDATGTEIWSATLTPATTSASTNTIGYCREDNCGNSAHDAFGTLTDHDFDHGGSDYNIDSLRVGRGAGSKSNLFLELDGSMPEVDWTDLTLHVGTHSFALSEARRKTPDDDFDDTDPLVSGNVSLFGWPGGNSPAVMTVGTPVAVKLVAADTGGAPAVSGFPQVGQALTAEIGSISDADDLPGTFPDDYGFQWVDAGTGTDIGGATSQTYVPVAGDEGKTLKVRVSFTDGGGTAETRESAETLEVVRKEEDCAADRPGAEWCSTITAGQHFTGRLGYSGVSDALTDAFGALSGSPEFDHGGTTYTVERVADATASVSVQVDLDSYLPRGTIFDLGGTEFTVDAASESHRALGGRAPGRYAWTTPEDFAWHVGQKVTVSARVPPELVSATINGSSLVLTYSEPLDAGSVPAPSQFEVVVNDDDENLPPITDVAITGSTVTMTAPVAADPGDTVTVSYTVPVSNPLQDGTGMAALALTDELVTNETTFWSATLTVGVGRQGKRGYLDGATLDFGTLEPNRFSHGGRSIRVLELTADDATNGAVTLDLTYEGSILDLSDLTLELAGEALPLADATVDATGKLFTWSQAWVTANAPSLAATNYAATLAEGAEVRACLRGGTEQMCPQAPSMDVTLSALSLTNAADASAIPLTPAFAAETASYTASVATGVTRIAVRATASDAGAGLEYLDGRGMALTDRVSGGRQLPLSVGANRIQVKVTAADGATTGTYTVVVTRAAPTVAALVSNTGQAATTAVDVGTSGASRFSAAQPFVSGDAARYALSSVQFHVSDFGGTDSAADVKVTVAENGAGDRPGATLHTLSGPATVTNDALNAFTAAPGAALDGNGTTYWIVVEGGASHFKAGTASTDALDAGTAAGWDIGESRYGRTSDGGAWTSDAAELRVAVSGHAVAGMASMDAALSSLGLGRDVTVTVSPSFDPAVTEYRAWSGDSDGEVTVAPRARDGGATVELLDADDAAVPDADDVSDGHQVQFEPGVNTLKLRVTAEDRATTQTYTVTLVQEAQEPDPADPAAVWHANLTVGTGESGGTALAGFNASADRGDLSRAQFRVDGRWINVPVLEHGGGKLRFQYLARSAGATLGGDDYVLEVDGHRFDLPDAGPTGDHEFTDPGLGWSWGDVVTVKLRRAADATAPVLQRASVSGSTLALVYDDEMDGTTNPGPETFAVKVDGGSGTAPASVAIDGRVVTLTLGTAVTAGQRVTLSYGLPAQTVLLRNASGGAAGFFVDRAVTNDTGATPVVAVEAVTESAIFRRDAAVYRVSRISGPVAGALQVAVALSQERAFLAAGSLSKSVTIPANAVEAELRLEPGAFRAFPEGERIASGALTATVLDGAGHDVDTDKASAAVDIRVAVTIGLDMSAYTFDEAAGTVEIPLVARTGERAELHPETVSVSFSSAAGTAASPADYAAVSTMFAFQPEDYVAAGTVLENVREVPFTIVDDDEAEQAETFELVLQMSPGMSAWHLNFVDGEGNACGGSCRYTVTITDNDMTDGLSALAVTNAADGAAITLSPAFDPATTGYSAQVPDDVTQVTVAATAADAASTVTYRDASDVEITDANGIEGGQQVDLVQGTNTIRVRVAMDVGPGRENVQVYTVTVTRIVPGAPEIRGVTQAGQALTALPGTIADPDGLPATTFPTGYTFQWVRVDGTNETDIPGATDSSYTLAADDEGKTVKVRAGFTDGGGTPETRESAASGTVRAMQESCSADRPHADWCTTMTVGRNRDRRGFPLGGGTLDDRDFVHGGTSWTVEAAYEYPSRGILLFGLDRRLPRGTKLDLGGNEVTADAGSEFRSDSAAFADTWTVSPLPDWLAGQKVTLSANLPPALVGATVDGTSLVLTWAEALDEASASVPAADAFAVKVDDGASAAPSGVAVSGDTVTLTLADAVTAGQAVTVSYTVPASGRLQDESGLPAAALTDEPVANQAVDGTGNRPASGAPTIHVEGVLGAPRVGDTLVADVSAIRDGDGIEFAVFAYRWIRTRGGVDTPIPGADGREHLQAPADEGAAVRVEVSFTDDSLEAEGPLASVPTEAVLARPSDGCTSDTLRLAGGDVASEGSVEYCRNNQFRSACDDGWDKADADVACRMAGYPDGALDVKIGSFFVNLVDTAFWLDELSCTGDESSLAECGHAGWGVNDCTYNERAGVMCDPGAPMAAAAAVDGTMLVITFDEALAPAPNLSNDAFTVWKTPEGGSEEEAALSVPPSIDGATVTLTLATGVVESDTGVRVRYEKPGTDAGNRLRDGEGNDVETFTRGATNATGPMPVAVSAAVDGTTLVVTFSKDLAAAPNLANASFTVKKTPEGGSEGTAGLTGSPAIDGATVTLTLATAAVSGDTVTVGYAKPGTGTDNALEDDAGREVESFDGLAVTNNSNAPATGAPAISGVPQAGMTLAATPGTMADADGLTGRFPDHYGFQWVRVESGAETEVGGDSHEYTLEDADVGSTLKVRVTFKDDVGGTEGPLESAETVAVLAAAEDCATARPHADWCTTMTVGIEAGVLDRYGYRGAAGTGSLVDDSFDYGGLVHVVEAIITQDFGDTETVFMAFDRELPAFTVYDLGGREITTDEGRTSFSDVLTSGLDWLEGQEVTVSLNRPPGRETATVDGTSLVLAYGEDLDEASVPAPAAYTVTVDGSEATVSDVSISGPEVTLTLADAVMPRQTVTVNYTPGADPVQDESGLDAAGFMNKAVENETLDTTAPAFSSAQVDGTTLVIRFDEELAAAPNLANGAFTVKRTPESGTEETVGLTGTPSVSGMTVTLTLAAAVLPTDTDVKVSYGKPSTDDSNRLEDAAGNEVADFDDEEVTIGSGPATGAPSVSGPPQVGKTLT
ncbi:MAG: hypothetical protein F4Y57_15130, partial [Acidobacteria bacterium]|nr:hypothetical protein [Acidobacteriota bacterium]